MQDRCASHSGKVPRRQDDKTDEKYEEPTSRGIRYRSAPAGQGLVTGDVSPGVRTVVLVGTTTSPFIGPFRSLLGHSGAFFQRSKAH